MFGPGWKAAVEATLRIAPSPRARIAGQDQMAELGQGADVEVDHLAEPVERAIGELAGEAEAGIVDQGADAEPLGLELGDQAGGGALLGEVGGEDMDLAADLRGERLHPVAAARDQRQRLAARRALPRELGAEPRRRAGDQGDGPRVSPSARL